MKSITSAVQRSLCTLLFPKQLAFLNPVFFFFGKRPIFACEQNGWGLRSGLRPKQKYGIKSQPLSLEESLIATTFGGEVAFFGWNATSLLLKDAASTGSKSHLSFGKLRATIYSALSNPFSRGNLQPKQKLCEQKLPYLALSITRSADSAIAPPISPKLPVNSC